MISGRAPRKFESGEHFRDCCVGRRTPTGSLAWSVLWHIVFAALLVQFGRFVWHLPETSAFENARVVWQGAAEDLPLVSPAAPARKPDPSPRAVAQTPKPVSPEPGAQAFHPTQTIISAPKVITHPEQTLVRPDLPQVAPKILPALPNIVEAEPERPKLQITQDELARIKPKDPIARHYQNAAIPELPNDQPQAADVNFAAAPTSEPKNPLFMRSGSSAVHAPKQHTVQAASGPEPPLITGGARQSQPLIALSATPAPAAPQAPVPAGNLSANVSVSPQGQHAGSPAATPKTSGTGNGPNGISISGGQPRGLSGMSGLGSQGNTPRNLHVAPGSQAPQGAKSASTGAQVARQLPPGVAPEHLFADRKVYTLHVSTPNVNSASGSWLISFAEMDDGPNSLHPPREGQMILPVAQHKEDPQIPAGFCRAKNRRRSDSLRDHSRGWLGG